MSESLEEKVAALERKLEETSTTIIALNEQLQIVMNYLRNPHLTEQNMRNILGRLNNLETSAVPQYSLFYEIGRMKATIDRENNQKLEKVKAKQKEMEEKQDILKEKQMQLVDDVEATKVKLNEMERVIDVIDVMELD